MPWCFSSQENGPSLFNTEPSGVFNEYYAQSIGSRSQAARTYLERTYDSYPDSTEDDLINHALLALKEAAPDHDINSRNVTVAIVGIGQAYTQYDDELVQPYIDRLQAAEESAAPAADAAAN